MSRFTEADRDAVNEILARRDGTGVPSMMQVIERIASDAARAAERALVESLSKLADEWERDVAQQKDRAARAAGDRRQPYLTNAAFYEVHARRLRAALAAVRPDDDQTCCALPDGGCSGCSNCPDHCVCETGIIDAAHLANQRDWSERTFGPGPRTLGVLDHIRKELAEIEAAPSDVQEWVDVIILAFDGAWRAGWEPQQIIDAIKAKQAKNEARTWPDWRTADPDRAIEHVETPAVRPDTEGAEGAGRVSPHPAVYCGLIENHEAHDWDNTNVADARPVWFWCCGINPASDTITIRRPHVLYSPEHLTENEADVDYLRAAARNIRYSRCMGSNLTNTVERLLLDAADALAARPDTTEGETP